MAQAWHDLRNANAAALTTLLAAGVELNQEGVSCELMMETRSALPALRMFSTQPVSDLASAPACRYTCNCSLCLSQLLKTKIAASF